MSAGKKIEITQAHGGWMVQVGERPQSQYVDQRALRVFTKWVDVLRLLTSEIGPPEGAEPTVWVEGGEG